MTSQPWIRIDQLSRYYHRGPAEVRAVDGVSLQIERGEFLGITGASGSGKSTVLNLLAGLDTPTSGHITFAGIPLDSLTRREISRHRGRRIGMVFQSFNLIAHLSAQANVAMALLFDGTPRAERLERASSILSKLGLADRMEHRPSDLSGGEQQRVALARALVKEPELLLADEPTGNLDHENSHRIAALLKERNAQGLTVVMVTHDLGLARDNCSRIVRMEYGQLMNEPAVTGGGSS
jgi:putative ABC transport system ATP-binding protein